ncbi:hypothetical protein [Streptomyces sp. WAC06614]|uniref:hypothetical protein n=1 Tax=Streptomyces sp. WAC06614 TaxID=2487416 RepID=UPI000F79725E|nr:hypothetical protein [Streptomyces sp. WAC06614]RSS80016.1 hypothetical protein EF918_15145 [Streptomyces sp. WAC06614]
MNFQIPLPSDPSTSEVYTDWVKIHDPGAGPAALELLDAVREGARRAYEKPGAFLSAMQWRARRLPPAHLPWFWETVGHRLFRVHPRTAGRAFTLARKAEREHRLPVDTDRHRAAVRMFVRAGALATAELSAHQTWLADVRGPVAAHTEFVEVLADWTAAGGELPSDLATRLRASARAAGLGTAEDARVIVPMVAAARGQAVPDRLLDAVAKLTATHPPAEELHVPLLELFPDSRKDAAAWLRLLLRSGVADAAAAGRAEPAGGLTDWLRRYARTYGHQRTGGGISRQPMPEEILELVVLFAPRIKAAGTPVRLHEDRYRWPGLDADLLDVCLAEGIPVEDPGPTVRLQYWGDRSKRDLKALAADPVFGRRLEGTVHAARHGGGTAITRLPENAGITAEVHTRIEALLRALRGGGLAAADEAVNELHELLDRPTATALDGIEEALAELDLTGPLARALRAGLPEELGWPALEAALAGFAPGEQIKVTSTWPVLTLYSHRRAVAVDHAGERGSCTFTLPDDATFHSVHHVGGDHLVAWTTHERNDWGEHAFWASRPEEVFTPEQQLGLRPYDSMIQGGLGFHFETPDGGGRHDGERVLRPGGREGIGDLDLMMSDGRRFWSAPTFHTHDKRTRVDPLTGEPTGDRNPPEALRRAGAPDGWADSDNKQSLAALPDGAPESPLGQDGRLVGCRVFHRTPWSGYSPREFLLESLDGRRAEYRTRTWGRDPWGILAMPAGGEDVVAVDVDTIRCHAAEDNSLLWQVRSFAGSPRRRGHRSAATLGEEVGPVPPPAFWHFLTARDETASKTLRSVDDRAVRALLDAALEEDRTPALPGVTEPRVAEGVARAARLAADVLRRRRELSRRIGIMRSAPAVTLTTAVPDTDLTPALHGLLPMLRAFEKHMPQRQPALLTSVAADGRHLRGEIDDETRRLALPAAPPEWAVLVGGIDAVAWRAAVAHTPDEERAALAALLETWSRQPFAETGSTWRIGRAGDEALEACRAAGAVVASTAARGGLARFLQRGTDPAPAGAQECTTVTIDGDDTARLPRLLELLDRHGPLTVPPEAVDLFCWRTGLRRPLAVLVLAGLPAREHHDDNTALLRKLPYKLSKELIRDYGMLLAHELGSAGQRAVLAAGVPEDPAELWQPGGMTAAAARMAKAWVGLLGTTPYVDEQLAVQMEEDLGLGADWATALTAGRAPEGRGDFGKHGFVLRPTPEGELRLHLRRSDGTTGTWMAGSSPLHQSVGSMIVWALTERPVGDPAAAGALALYTRLRAVLDDPGTLVPVLYPRAPGLVGAPGFAPYEGACVPCPEPFADGVTEAPTAHDNGLFVVAAPRGDVFVRTASLADADQVERAVRLCADLRLTALQERLTTLRAELAGLDRIVARAADTPVGAGGYETNPALSVPDLVAEVARTLGTGADAAALYLQLLTLSRPTDKNLRRWNGWSADRHKSAQAELVATGAVLSGRRPRAGRTAFVPGEWTDLKAPHLPLEQPKAATHLASVHGRSVHAPYLRLLAPEPVHEMFARAWARSREVVARQNVTHGS